MIRMPASSVVRCTGFGRGERDDNARMIGMRATARAGHHADAVAVTTASIMLAPISQSGTLRPSIRWAAVFLHPLGRNEPCKQAHPRADYGSRHTDKEAVG